MNYKRTNDSQFVDSAPTDTKQNGKHPSEQPFRFGKIKIEHWQIISVLLALYDYLAVIGSYFIALWLRFDAIYSQIPNRPYSYPRPISRNI